MVDYDKLDIGSGDEDKVIYHLNTNTDFLKLCIRKKLKPSFFSSDARRKIVEMIFDYFRTYKKCPSYILPDLIADKISRRLLKKEDQAILFTYIDVFTDSEDGSVSPEYLIDRIDFFIQKRTAFTALNRLNKLKDRLESNPEKMIEVMREAIKDADIGKTKNIETFLNNPLVDIPTNVITRFNIEEIDRPLGGGLKVPNLVVLQGYTGRGKSWAIVHLAKIAVRFGYCVLVVINEMSNKVFRQRLQMSLAGMTTGDLRSKRDEAQEQINRSFLQKSDIVLVSEDEKNMPIDDLESIIEESEQELGKPIKLILLDSADDCLPPKTKQCKSRIEESTAIYTWLKNFSKDEDKCIVTTSQSQRRGETLFWLTSKTIGDDINKVRKATLGISINAREEEVRKNIGRLLVFKNTNGPTGARCWFKPDFFRGQFCKQSGKYNMAEYKQLLETIKGEEE